MKKYLFLLATVFMCAMPWSNAIADVYKYTKGEKLITNVSQLSSNVEMANEGAGLAGLIDGDASTYCHSTWGSAGLASGTYQNITVSLDNAVSAIYVYWMNGRNAGQTYYNDFPKNVNIYGSNDNSNWTLANKLEGVGGSTGKEEYTSGALPLGDSYKYLRFDIAATHSGRTGGDGVPFFCLSEFQVYEAVATAIPYATSLENEKYYYIVSGYSNFSYATGTQAMYYSTDDTNSPKWKTLDATDNKFVFKLYKADDNNGWYIQNAYNEKFFGGSNNDDEVLYTKDKDVIQTIEPVSGQDGYFTIINNTVEFHLYPGRYGVGTDGYVQTNEWGDDAPGAAYWRFAEVSEDIVNGIASAKETAINTLTSQINNNYKGEEDYVFGITSDNKTAALSELNNSPSLETLENNFIDKYLTPLTTGYYRLYNKNKNYLTVTSQNEFGIITDNDTKALSDLSSVFKVVVDDQENGIATMQSQGLYLGNIVNSNEGATTPSENSQSVKIQPFAGGSDAAVSITIPSSGNRYLFILNWATPYVRTYYTIAGKEPTLQHYLKIANNFTITTNAVGSETYATLYAPFPVSLPDGLTAYTGELKTDNGKNLLLLTKVDGTIPAATPVILIGNDASKTSYTLGIVNADVEGLNQPNSLTGQYLADTAAGSTDLTLGLSNSGNVGFYKYSGTISANKARLTGFSGSKGFTFTFGDDDPTGINTATVSGATLTVGDVIYDLQGRRVQDAKHGIYIINGKKTVVK